MLQECDWQEYGQSILPLCPFGSSFYYHCLINGAQVDTTEHYIKQSYRNRYEILSANGRLILEIPVVGQKGKKIATRDIKIFDERWQSRHLKSIKTSYGAAPFFIHLIDDLEQLFGQRYTWLADFSLKTIEWSQQWIALPSLTPADSYIEPQKNLLDLRSVMKASKMRVDQDRYLQTFSDRIPFESNLSVLDLVMHLGPEALHYIKQIPKKVELNI